MPYQFEDVGARLRAYRLGMNYTAAQVAEKIGISRAAVYHLERGELVKIETLAKLSDLLQVSLPSLLGPSVEYYSNAVAFFERMRQLEGDVIHIAGNFSPISFLLVSDSYMSHLRGMLLEAVPDRDPHRAGSVQSVETILGILHERRLAAARKRTPIASLVGTQDLERFLRTGLIGRYDLAPDVQAERREAARREVQRVIDILLKQPIGVQVGVIEDMPPTQTFQILEKREGATVALSPYRLGDHPNVSSGIAMVTSAPEAVRLFRENMTAQWDRAHKGESAAQVLLTLLARTNGCATTR